LYKETESKVLKNLQYPFFMRNKLYKWNLKSSTEQSEERHSHPTEKKLITIPDITLIYNAIHFKHQPEKYFIAESHVLVFYVTRHKNSPFLHFIHLNNTNWFYKFHLPPTFNKHLQK